MKVAEHVPLASLTTFKLGGPARFVVTLESSDDAPRAVQFAKEKNLPLVPFGGGSNVLANDTALNAVLLKVGMDAVCFDSDGVYAEAGASWDALVGMSVERGLWGIENLSAIPGTVGGAVVQNVGAYGEVLSQTLSSVDVFDTHTMTHTTIARDACDFGYRTNIFKRERDRYIVLGARLVLKRIPSPQLGYKDLKEFFKDTVPTLTQIRAAVVEIRARKFPSLTEFGTAGSFFLNPIVNESAARDLQGRYPDMPVFTLPEGGIKIPLGWFFEHVLKLKGTVEHNVEAWRNQALVLTAHPGARAEDVRAFAEKIISLTKSELNIDIEPEVRFL